MKEDWRTGRDVDLTSSLYLGFNHPWNALRPWATLTIGKPFAIGETSLSRDLGRRLASLTGCEDAVLGTSTFHIFWDLFQTILPEGAEIFVDAGAYPIARWAVQCARARRSHVATFGHHDASALSAALRRCCHGKRRAIVVTDGYCTSCGRSAPLRQYHAAVSGTAGVLVIDDTQALGVLGQSPDHLHFAGAGGGGSLRHLELTASNIILVSSLAKGFGAPTAVLCATREYIRAFRTESETRLHCSPPSNADLRAVENALRLNAAYGEALRLRLRGLVGRFRRNLLHTGLTVRGGAYPMQSILLPTAVAVRVSAGLKRQGVRTLLQGPCRGDGLAVTAIVNARHTLCEIDRASRLIAKTVTRCMSRRTQSPQLADTRSR